ADNRRRPSRSSITFVITVNPANRPRTAGGVGIHLRICAPPSFRLGVRNDLLSPSRPAARAITKSSRKKPRNYSDSGALWNLDVRDRRPLDRVNIDARL